MGSFLFHTMGDVERYILPMVSIPPLLSPTAVGGWDQWRRAILSLGAVPPPKTKIRGPAPPPQIEGQGPVVKGRSGQESGERG